MRSISSKIDRKERIHRCDFQEKAKYFWFLLYNDNCIDKDSARLKRIALSYIVNNMEEYLIFIAMNLKIST
jgi:hypothetical protein